MSKGLLIDTTRCIGCRACQVACKSWNDLRVSNPITTFSNAWTNPQYLTDVQYTRVIFQEVSRNGKLNWYFTKAQCMHCLDPACASACPVGALQKHPDGPVVYDDAKCFGCRYCMMACPFQIPKYEWGSAVPLVRKCSMCADRQAIGQAPACATTCPTQTLLFGDRDQLLKEAHRRLAANPGKYSPEVYGEKIVGGTSVLYLTAVSFDQLGLTGQGFRTDLGEIPFSSYGRAWMAKVPTVAAAVATLCVGLFLLNKRRADVSAHEHKED